MNRFSINRIGGIAAAILSVGVVSGCEYCLPLLLAIHKSSKRRKRESEE